MADKTLTTRTAVTVIGDTDEYYVEVGGNSRKITGASIKALFATAAQGAAADAAAVAATLASTSNGEGASLIGVEDSGGLTDADDVEAYLAENRAAIDAIEADYLQAGDIASGTITPRDDDVDLSGGSTGDVLRVQSDGSLAIEALPAAGAFALDDATDVGLDSPADNDLLVFVTDHWENQTIAEAGVATAAQGSLADSALQAASIGVSVQAYDAQLDDLAAVDDSGAGDGDFLGRASSAPAWRDPSEVRADLSLEIGTDVQAWDAQLDTWAGVTPSANGQSLVAAADYAAMRGLLDLEAGTDFYSITAADAAFQPIDSDLTALAALTAPATKLAGIEDAADVTDATNVAAAGAVMTSGAQLVSAQANNDLTANPKFWLGSQGEYDGLTPTAGEIYYILEA